MEKKTIVALAKVLPGKEKEFISHAEIVINATRSTEEGNISYNLYQNPFDSSAFIFYEEYKNQEAIDQHAKSAHFNAFFVAIKPLLAADLTLETY